MKLKFLVVVGFVFAILALSVAQSSALTMTINSPENKTYNTTNIFLNVTTDLLSTLFYRLNGGTITMLFNGNYNGVSNLGTAQSNNPPAQGGNVVFLNATNGTEQANQTIVFTVDTVPPSVNLRSPADGFNTDNPTNNFEFVPVDSFLQSIPCSLYLNGSQVANPVNVLNDTRGKITTSLTAGTYSWSIKCYDNFYNTGSSESRTITVKPKCGVDASELTGKGNLLSLVLENTGTLSEDIDYSIKVNLNNTVSGYTKLSAGEKREVLHNFTFSIGNYQLEATASSNCGAQDYVSSGYSKTSAPSDCTNPVGVHNSLIGAPTENKIFKCNNGFWDLISSDQASYCNSPIFNHCGDGSINCMETVDTCSVDYNTSVKCDCINKTLSIENVTRSDQEFFDTCKSTCSLQCNTDSDCSSGYGCTYFTCLAKSTICGVRIQDFDYTSQTGIGENGKVFASIKNTGEGRENITTKLLVDGQVKDLSSFNVNSNSDKLSNLTYTAPVGQHDLSVEASANCGSTDSKSAKTVVRNISVASLPQGPLSTEVRLTSQILETGIGTEKPLQLNIKTNRPQLFNLRVTGVSPEWLNYPSTIGVTQDRSVNLFVKPSQKGDYNVTIYVEGTDQNFTTTATIKVLTVGQSMELNQNWVIVLVVSIVILFSVAFSLAGKILKLE